MKRTRRMQTDRPRLIVYRSIRRLQAQILSADGRVILGARSEAAQPKRRAAGEFALTFAKACQAKKIEALAFDRRQYRYTGRIKAFVDGLRAAGVII